MKGYIGYTRVSTVKQGEKGVSLKEQKSAIERYAAKHKLSVTIWLKEVQTAAKRGRPVFNQMLKLLRQGKAQGIIVHKLDRGVRNLKDWADMGELADQGAEVHFASEGLDLQSRSGRLSADIQAVVAADYIRNLREETRKGFYGRLKQGLYPLAAPLGYLNHGKGKKKTICPKTGPLVKKAFDLYATGSFSLDDLNEELRQRGLRNLRGSRVSRNGLSRLLRNPFYIGLIHLVKTNETFAGIHTPLVSKVLFDQVQGVIAGKLNGRSKRHDYLFRRMFSCATCGLSLVAERQKGRVYYRCHTRTCQAVSIREDAADAAVRGMLDRVRFNEQDQAMFRDKLLQMRSNWASEREIAAKALRLSLASMKDRLNRLTDAYLDQALDREAFEERKKALLLEQKEMEERLQNLSSGDAPLNRLEKILEQAQTALLSYEKGEPEEKRQIVKTVTSNRQVEGKKLCFRLSNPFQVVAERRENATCDPHRADPRMLEDIISALREEPDTSVSPNSEELPEENSLSE